MPDDSRIPPLPYDIDGVRVWRHPADPARLYYLPAEPVPELNQAGKPCLHLLEAPEHSTLQLGVHFVLRPEGEAALLSKIEGRNPSLAGASLQPAPLQVLKAAVLLADAAGAETGLGVSKPSAFPPFAAMFSLTLTSAQAARAMLSITGDRGILFVEYTVRTRDSDVPVARRCDVADWFPGHDGKTHIRILACPLSTTTQQETTDDR